VQAAPWCYLPQQQLHLVLLLLLLSPVVVVEVARAAGAFAVLL
jgi:hypothetical protein